MRRRYGRCHYLAMKLPNMNPFDLPALAPSLIALALSSTVYAEHEVGGPSKSPQIAMASDEGGKMAKGIKIPAGLKIDLFAAEPNLASPVSFTFDEKGRCYVVETFRLHQGVTDIRGHMDWLDEDLACRTVDDRLAMMKRHEGDKIGAYSQWSDRIRLLEDRNGDGKVDYSSVFADGFNHPLDGIAAGVLASKGQVWFANIPHVWSLKDTNNDGVADLRKSISYGYGVRVGFLGHDLHGLTLGPDGRLYFSIGDRGSSVTQNGRQIGHTDTGSVFRCNQDGSDLEEFAFGLRNPQELVFDELGNLFTGDNNSDGGDRARWVYIVEGGDSGWRVGWQFIEYPNSRGPWNAEKMWHPQWDGQAAHLLPPIAWIGNGPSGVAYHPGTGFSPKYKNHFFMVDFRGSRGSGVYSFTLKPKGAAYELQNAEETIWNCLPTDVGFGPDGGLYISDWVEGWGLNGKGRIYRISDPAVDKAPETIGTKTLLAAGGDNRSEKELLRLLSHADQRVRQMAQFELASRGPASIKSLSKTASSNSTLLARIHAIWALGQLAQEKTPGALDAVAPLLSDGDAEIVAQACRVVGDARLKIATSSLIPLLGHPVPRVQFLAAQALARIGDRAAVAPAVAMLVANQDKDPYLRHAGVMILASCAELTDLLECAKHQSASARLGSLLTMRRLGLAEVGLFLKDIEPRLVLEAARAINDGPISGAIPELAELGTIAGANHPPELLRRIVNANFRYGRSDTVKTLADLALRKTLPEGIRAEALLDIQEWAQPNGKDRVSGLWRPTAGARSAADAVGALQPAVEDLLGDQPESVRIAAIRASTALHLSGTAPLLLAIIQKQQGGGSVRVEALRALAQLHDDHLTDALGVAQKDPSEDVRKEALKLASQVKPSGALAQIAEKLEVGSMGEKQTALTALGTVSGAGADALLVSQLDLLIGGKLPKELTLDLTEAARLRLDPAVKTKLAAYEAGLPQDDLKEFRATLFGGNAAEGRKIFYEKAEVACNRCHKENGDGGEVGPELTGLISRQKREYMLESIITPNKQIAAGFESVLISLNSGLSYAGIIKSETPTEIVINSPEDGLMTIKKSEIKGRDRGASGMPEGFGAILSKNDLRNLIEYLSSTK